MGDESNILAKGINKINIDNGYFKNVLFVLDLGAILVSIYKMKHTGWTKRVKFTQYDVYILNLY